MFDRVDAVSVCLPHTLHRAATAARKHIRGIGDVVMAQDTILAGVPAAGLGWRGTLALAGGGVQVARTGATAWETVPVGRPRSGHEGEIAEFVAAVREGRPPSVSGEDGSIAVEMVLAIYRASEHGAVFHLPLQ